jgi:hypothetical protein
MNKKEYTEIYKLIQERSNSKTIPLDEVIKKINKGDSMTYKNKEGEIINLSKNQVWKLFVSGLYNDFEVKLFICNTWYRLEYFTDEKESQLFIDFIYDRLINDKDNATYVDFEIWKDG